MEKVWLIPGSNRGLVRALAEAVLANGEQLVATARRSAQLVDLADRYGGQVRAVGRTNTRDTCLCDPYSPRVLCPIALRLRRSDPTLGQSRSPGSDTELLRTTWRGTGS